MAADLIPFFYELFKDVEGIELVATDYPKKWETFPSIIYRTTQTPYRLDAKNVEQMTRWDIVVEIYGSESVHEQVVDLKEKFRKINMFGRTREANTMFLNRTICDFKGAYDNESKIMYKA